MNKARTRIPAARAKKSATMLNMLLRVNIIKLPRWVVLSLAFLWPVNCDKEHESNDDDADGYHKEIDNYVQ